MRGGRDAAIGEHMSAVNQALNQKQRVIVTGGSGAFGLATCLALAEQGRSVVATMRSSNGKNESAARALRDAGVHIVEFDVTDDDSVERGVRTAIDHLGGLDVLFNNAGIGAAGVQELFTPEDMQKVFDVNVFGVQRVLRAALPTMRTQGRGTLLFTSSLIGRITTPFYASYCASKWALEALADSYRSELSMFGIETCIVEPGAMPTGFFESMVHPSDHSRDETYRDMSAAVSASSQGMVANLNQVELQRPDRVAEAVLDLLNLPHGEKPLRTVVDHLGVGPQIEKYNNALHEATRAVFTQFGNADMLALNK